LAETAARAHRGWFIAGWLRQVMLDAVGNRFRAAADSQFRKHPADVVLDRRNTDHQFGGDFGVGFAIQ